MRALWAVLLAAIPACDDTATQSTGPDAATNNATADAAVDSAPFLPDTCHGSPLLLDGMAGLSTQPDYGPVTVDTTGTTICLSLDARNNLQFAHFMSNTRYEPGNASPFELALFDATDTLIVAGWDVQVGNASTQTFANLEHAFTPGQIYAAKLVVRSKSTPATTIVPLRLFEPYE